MIMFDKRTPALLLLCWAIGAADYRVMEPLTRAAIRAALRRRTKPR